MSEVKHTALPWRAKGQTVYADDEPVADTWKFTGMDAEANARLIVKAVNNHARLVEALREVAELDSLNMENAIAWIEDNCCDIRALLQELEDE